MQRGFQRFSRYMKKAKEATLQIASSQKFRRFMIAAMQKLKNLRKRHY